MSKATSGSAILLRLDVWFSVSIISDIFELDLNSIVHLRAQSKDKRKIQALKRKSCTFNNPLTYGAPDAGHRIIYLVDVSRIS